MLGGINLILLSFIIIAGDSQFRLGWVWEDKSWMSNISAEDGGTCDTSWLPWKIW